MITKDFAEKLLREYGSRFMLNDSEADVGADILEYRRRLMQEGFNEKDATRFVVVHHLAKTAKEENDDSNSAYYINLAIEILGKYLIAS